MQWAQEHRNLAGEGKGVPLYPLAMGLQIYSHLSCETALPQLLGQYLPTGRYLPTVISYTAKGTRLSWPSWLPTINKSQYNQY